MRILRSNEFEIFQSTLPLRGVTKYNGAFYDSAEISIHTPLAGSDELREQKSALCMYFNPHSPCGE